MPKYTLQIFDSRNTCYVDEIIKPAGPGLINHVKSLSLKSKFPVIVHREGSWIKFEQGQQTEWSMVPMI